MLRMLTASFLLITGLLVTGDAIKTPTFTPQAMESDGTQEAVSARVDEHSPSTVIHRADAGYLKLHFDSLHLQPGAYLTVSDSSGSQARTIRGSGPQWAVSVEGDTAIIALHNGSGSATVDTLFRGYSAQEMQERAVTNICGTDQSQEIACFKATFPAEFEHSAAVAQARITFKDPADGKTKIAACTAFRIGATNRMLTNNHCLSPSTWISGDILFNYQCATCTGTELSPGTTVAVDQILTTDAGLDFTLFTVTDFVATAQYGWLNVDPSTPVKGGQIYIPQHPGGGTKKLAVLTEGDGICTVNTVYTGDMIGYECDTRKGTSGSPVVSRQSHKVIALHFAGSTEGPCMNIGTDMSVIWPKIKDYMG
ncbi:serine protease [Pseudonocardiaceae bacterium YIM PH 21723]|nr:serine protease [Pseudonocardiaceae bacterium YIM PH 21723]